MKKYLIRGGVAIATIAVVLGGAAAFSAFEAHIVNVTATIENATDISTSALTFGEVFPQEILHNPITLALSSSFLSGANTRANSVDYVIKQKPKCGLPIPQVQGSTSTVVSYSAYETVTENSDGVFNCPDPNYVILPLLCPYLSKTSPTQGDISVPSFHGPTSTPAWTDAISIATQATGHLSKSGATSTTWDIDLHTPCFKGQCAQDWPTYVKTANPSADPNSYMADPAFQHQQYGCDLWYEVSGISTSNIVTVKAANLDNSSSSPAVVATDGLNKWFMYNDTTDVIDNTLGSFVVGPGSPPHGTGSVQFTLGATPLDRKNIATYQFSGTPLSTITQLSFASYSHSGVAGPNESPFLAFNVDFTGSSGAFQKRLVYVPVDNGAVPQNAWNTNDAIQSGNAKWEYSGATWPAPISLPGTTTRTWAQILAAYPSARLLPVGGWLGVRVGEPGPTNYIGNVDNVTVGISGNTTVYDFEP